MEGQQRSYCSGLVRPGLCPEKNGKSILESKQIYVLPFTQVPMKKGNLEKERDRKVAHMTWANWGQRSLLTNMHLCVGGWESRKSLCGGCDSGFLRERTTVASEGLPAAGGYAPGRTDLPGCWQEVFIRHCEEFSLLPPMLL